MFYLEQFDHGLDEVIAALEGKEKQLPFALAMGITRTAKRVKQAETDEISRVFDRPTRWTQNSVFLKPATKKNPEATVWLKDHAVKGTPAADYLAAQIDGGKREAKKSEWLMKRAGVLASNRFAVLAAGAKRNRHGNMSSGLGQRLLSNIGVQTDSGVTSNSGEGTHEYFVRRRKGRKGAALGVYRRMKGKKTVNRRKVQKIKPVLLFTRRPQYQERFRFYDVADQVAGRYLVSDVLDALDHARATAR